MDFVRVKDEVLAAAGAAALLSKTKTAVRVPVANTDKSVRVVKSELVLILRELGATPVTLLWFDGPEGRYVVVRF